MQRESNPDRVDCGKQYKQTVNVAWICLAGVISMRPAAQSSLKHLLRIGSFGLLNKLDSKIRTNDEPVASCSVLHLHHLCRLKA